MSDIVSKIDEKIGEVRYEALDMSFGEIVNLHTERELVIHPEYQRLFRWSNEQKSRLIESVLLELPIPQIFVIENDDGVLELIDGLQRVSSIAQFVDPDSLGLPPLKLAGCDLIPELDNMTFDDLPLTLRLRLKRSSVRTIVIKRQSQSFLRYEMFKRLNTGGASLDPQEIRNCSARMLGENGARFYEFIKECANLECFKACIETMSSADLEKKGDEELVLRFFATKNARSEFRGSVRDWLDDYMEDILLEKVDFNIEVERKEFSKVFSFFEELMGPGSFVKYRGESPIGALAPAYFEAISLGAYPYIGKISSDKMSSIRDSIIKTVQTEEFRKYTGPGANSREKLNQRISIISSAVEKVL